MATPTEAEMMRDLRAADAAGDYQLAGRIAERIRQSRSQPTSEPGTRTESAARGALQGLSFGFGDEASAAVAAALPFTDQEAVGSGATIGDRYRNARTFYRNRNATAERANPGTYGTAQVAGAVVPTLVGAAPLTGARAMGLAAGQGAAQGLGYSDASTLPGYLGDTALGAGVGLAGYGAGQIVGKGVAAVRGRAATRLARAEAKATEQAADAATDSVRSLEGAARERAANAYRQMERINLALADPALPAAERAALEAFKKSPEYAELLAANAKGIAAAAPDALAEREAARQIAGEARAALPAEIQSKAAKLMKPTVGADSRSFAKGWLEPIAWAAGAQQAADLLGMDNEKQGYAMAAGGLIGGRTRMGKALYTRLTRPGNQAAIAGAQDYVARLAQAMSRPAVAGATPAIIQALEDANR